MANIKELEYKQKELLKNLSLEELEGFIRKLAKDVFIAYLTNETTSFNAKVMYLKELASVYENEYPNINNYINFCLLVAINDRLKEQLNLTTDLVINDVDLEATIENDILKKLERPLPELEEEELYKRDLKLMKDLIEDKE